MDLTAALRWLNSAVISSTGNKLREPERVILKGTWRGLTYEQMADSSEYSTNYLMRDVAPKLWKQLSNVFGRSVGKTNFRVALEAYAAANTSVGSELLGLSENEAAMGEPIDGLDMSASSAMRQDERNNSRYWPTQTASLQNAETAGRFAEGKTRPSRYERPPTFRARVNTSMHGYASELSQVCSWLTRAQDEATESEETIARIVGIWGLTGVGKTTLAEHVLDEVGNAFDQVVVRSLQDKPQLSDLCASILAELGFSSQPGQSVSHLLTVMARKPVLLLLEDIEALLAPQQLAGDYLLEHRGYEDFFLGALGASGCVVVTGIEGPSGLVRQGGVSEGHRGQRVRSLYLQGLAPSASGELLQQEALSAQPTSMAATEELAARYQGHPLALKAAARVIREIFDGRVDEFLAQMSVLFTDVLRLLLPSFSRLSTAEINILYWLASQERPLSLAELKSTLPISLRPSELISALDSLKQRSLLLVQLQSRSALSLSEIDQLGDTSAPPTFSLPGLVKAYAIYQFVGQFGEKTEASVLKPAYGSRSDRLLEPIISLGSQSRSPVRLSRWFEGQFDTGWQPLESLFAAVARPAVRLRNAYRFRDETFVKRCKSVVLSPPSGKSSSKYHSLAAKDKKSAILLIAIHQDGENLYKICVQAQPATDDTVLPAGMELRLLDSQETVLAFVTAEQADSFIQLPSFQGAIDERFRIELVLEATNYQEQFVI